MRKLLILAALAALVGVQSPATAQDRGRHEGQDKGQDNGGRAGGNENRGGGPRSGVSQSAPNSENGRNAIGQRETREHHDAPSQARSAPAMAQAPDRGNDNRSDFNRQNRGDRNNDARQGDRGRQDFNRPGSSGPGFNNNSRGSRRDFSNFRNYHQNFRAERRFRVGPYRRPQGYYSHRWSWGEFLPAPFWARDYWLIDFFDYGLPPPPFGAIWVRVGDDALLIDRDSGEIIEVDYGVFY
jgi:Ni/Co efflux regulator RcnB